jgi:hypothetical protein
VIAEYPGDLSIVQAAPVRLAVPVGFSLARLAEIVFRIAGSSWWEARLLGRAYAAAPALLLDAPDRAGIIETAPMPGGSPAIVVDEVGDDGRPETTVLVSRGWGLYAVTSPDRATSLRIARDLLR